MADDTNILSLGVRTGHRKVMGARHNFFKDLSPDIPDPEKPGDQDHGAKDFHRDSLHSLSFLIR
jgi:hypothetical protein